MRADLNPMSDDVVTLWRVECIIPGHQEEGRGPYTSQPGPGDALEHFLAYVDWLKLRKPNDPRQMDTENDGLDPMTRASEFCAYDSLESLREWFHSGALEALASTGFYGVVRYEVPASAVQRGRHQVVFERAKALRREIVAETDL